MNSLSVGSSDGTGADCVCTCRATEKFPYQCHYQCCLVFEADAVCQAHSVREWFCTIRMNNEPVPVGFLFLLLWSLECMECFDLGELFPSPP